MPEADRELYFFRKRDESESNRSASIQKWDYIMSSDWLLCGCRLDSQHEFWMRVSDGNVLVHKSIPYKLLSSVADVGTGTG